MRFNCCVAAILMTASAANAGIRITEYMYSGTGAEYVELTNIGGTSVDLAGWSYDDNSATAGSYSLSGFGVVAPGESIVFTEGTAAQFILDWALTGTTVKVLGDNTQNLGRSDQINIYDASNALVDQLTFGDQVFAGTIRAQNASGWAYITGSAPYGNIDTGWRLSVVGDAQSSRASANGDIGSPGIYRAIPEPVSFAIVAGAACLRRRRHA